MFQLTHSDVLRRKIRSERWEDLGKSTWVLLRRAIEEGDKDRSLELLDYLYWEGKETFDQYTDWVWALFTYIANRWGEEELPGAIRASTEGWFRPFFDLLKSVGVEERVRIVAEAMRAHRGGPGLEGSVQITEEEDRYVLTFDPCGSGGRMRRGDELTGSPPRTEAPYNFGVTQKAYPWSWGYEGVPYYCIHCNVVHEMMSADFGDGYPLWVTDYNPDPKKPTRWFIYKDPSKIPEEYFHRIGRKKPSGPSAGNGGG